MTVGSGGCSGVTGVFLEDFNYAIYTAGFRALIYNINGTSVSMSKTYKTIGIPPMIIAKNINETHIVSPLITTEVTKNYASRAENYIIPIGNYDTPALNTALNSLGYGDITFKCKFNIVVHNAQDDSLPYSMLDVMAEFEVVKVGASTYVRPTKAINLGTIYAGNNSAGYTSLGCYIVGAGI